MATFTPSEHRLHDHDLITAAELSRLVGVSRAAVSQCVREEHGRLDVYLNSKGEKRFHAELSVAQWTDRRAARKVSTPTQGQKAAGWDGMAAQAAAHLPLTRPQGSAPPAGADTQDGDRRELAQSRAEKERFSARLLEIKVRKEEGSLVSADLFFQKAYTLTVAIKDQLNGIPPQLGPSVVAAVEEGLVAAGMTAEQARAAIDRGNLHHVVREGLRLGIVRALRTLTEKPVRELLS